MSNTKEKESNKNEEKTDSGQKIYWREDLESVNKALKSVHEFLLRFDRSKIPIYGEFVLGLIASATIFFFVGVHRGNK